MSRSAECYLCCLSPAKRGQWRCPEAAAERLRTEQWGRDSCADRRKPSVWSNRTHSFHSQTLKPTNRALREAYPHPLRRRAAAAWTTSAGFLVFNMEDRRRVMCWSETCSPPPQLLKQAVKRKDAFDSVNLTDAEVDVILTENDPHQIMYGSTDGARSLSKTLSNIRLLHFSFKHVAILLLMQSIWGWWVTVETKNLTIKVIF